MSKFDLREVLKSAGRPLTREELRVALVKKNAAYLDRSGYFGLTLHRCLKDQSVKYDAKTQTYTTNE